MHLARIRVALPDIAASINIFTLDTFRCRGGRMGSGMGGLIEALWGFYTRVVLTASTPDTYDIAWITDHAYNDFALLDATQGRDPPSRAGEIFRIEAKSMNLGADETKGHFDVLTSQVGDRRSASRDRVEVGAGGRRRRLPADRRSVRSDLR